MKRLRIELQIILLALVIGSAVITTGFFVYRSMSQIVSSIHREALPDNRFFLIKDIANDLGSLENNVRLYILTGNREDLARYDSLLRRIAFKSAQTITLPVKGEHDEMLADSIRAIALEKQELWQEILTLHESAKESGSSFTGIYSKLETTETDTVIVETPKKGFFRKILGGKKVTTDTVISERPLEGEKIREEIRNLETDMVEEGRTIKETESHLIEKNILLNKRLNNLIADAENKKATERVIKTREAGELASRTYKQVAAFILTAIVLLLVSLFVLFNYLKKSRATQQALQDARQKAEELAKAKQQFVANVSHELRTPVNAIYGLTEQALQKTADPGLKELMTIISTSSRHLKNIINDTLDFSRIEARMIRLETVVFSPRVLCAEVLSLQKYEANRKGISLDLVWDESVPEALRGDPLRLKQILINLVSNAVKFTATGGVRLKVLATPDRDNLTMLTMTVEDTGIGISEKNQQVIFDEFVQAQNVEGKKYGGTGLGLHIVKKLVELHGGTIGVNSKEGKGTQITVSIPYAAAPEGIIRTVDHESMPVLPVFGTLSVLIADDDEFNTYLLKVILKKWGIVFETAGNGKEAVKAALRGHFDLILMDLNMPEMDGKEAAKTILREKPGTKIVAVSATHDPEEQSDSRKAGMVGFMHKPFTERELYDLLLSMANGEKEKPREVAPPLDKAELSRLANGDRAFLEEMIRLFIRSAQTAMKQIEDALLTNDLDGVSAFAHKISPSTKQVGAASLYALIKQLEERSGKGEVAEIRHTF